MRDLPAQLDPLREFAQVLFLPPALFAERAGLAPDQALHVGDDPLADVEGARRAGIEAVWVNRREEPWPDGLEPPARTVRSLAELVTALGA